MSTDDPRALAARVLQRVETDEAFSHVALDAELASSHLDPRDRRLATRIVYGTLAMQRPIDALLTLAMEAPVEKRTRPMERAVLRSAVYQLRFLERVPAHAAVHAAVEHIRKVRGKSAAGFVNAVLRRVASGRDTLPEPREPAARLGLRHSLPDDLARRALERFGAEEAEAFAAALNAVPPLTLRAGHAAAPDRAALEALATSLGATPARFATWALHASALDEPVARLLAGGTCMVQDEGSQLIVHWAGAAARHTRIWDACAGQGGKTLQLLDLLRRANVSATLVSTDTFEAKIHRLREAVVRHLGAPTERGASALPGGELWTLPGGLRLETGLVDAQRPPVSLEPFDLVLVDAPCSGFGLMRRHPETRWRRGGESVQALTAIQRRILDGAASRVRGGGVLLYAVCTNTVEETRAQVESFVSRRDGEFSLQRAPGLESLGESLGAEGALLELMPHRHGTDGFFAARLVRAEAVE